MVFFCCHLPRFIPNIIEMAMTKPPEVINEKFVQQKVKLYPQNTNRLLNCIQLKIKQKYKNIKCSYFSGWMLWWVSTTFFKSSTRPSTTSSITFIVTIRQVIWFLVSWKRVNRQLIENLYLIIQVDQKDWTLDRLIEEVVPTTRLDKVIKKPKSKLYGN